MYRFRNFMIIFFCFSGIFYYAEAVTEKVKRKHDFLHSLTEDCRTYFESIHLFTVREYTNLWDYIYNEKMPVKRDKKNQDIPPEIIFEKYLLQTQYFRKQLDDLLDEYISIDDFSKFSQLGVDIDHYQNKFMQILALTYIKIGDFNMALQIKQTHGGAFYKTIIIELSSIRGKKVKYNITENLNKWYRFIEERIEMIQFDFRNFSRNEALHMEMVISDVMFQKPFSLFYLNYFKKYLDIHAKTISDEKDAVIPFQNFRSYLARMERLKLYKFPEREQQQEYIQTYVFPMIKGNHTLRSLQNNMKIETTGKKNYTIEHNWQFVELADDQGQSIQDIYLIAEDSKLDNQIKIQVNDWSHYGTYKMYNKNNYMGKVLIYPCDAADDCEKKNKKDSITLIPVFDHKLLLTKNSIDRVYETQKLYGVQEDFHFVNNSFQFNQKLSLEIIDDQQTKNRHIRPGMWGKYRYLYRLYQKGQFVGNLELIQCEDNENCQVAKGDLSFIKIKVFDHKLALNEAKIKAISENHQKNGKPMCFFYGIANNNTNITDLNSNTDFTSLNILPKNKNIYLKQTNYSGHQFHIDKWLPYGTYKLFEGDKYKGTFQLIFPTESRDNKSIIHSDTRKITVYGNMLVFTQDMLATEYDKDEVIKSDLESNETIHLFRGCTTTQSMAQ